jgi:hypothetical protein
MVAEKPESFGKHGYPDSCAAQKKQEQRVTGGVQVRPR